MKSVILGGFVAIVCAFANAQPKAISDFTGRVVGVMDGDTAKVLVGSQSIIVRLEGIDTP
jgi:endonuclease YncB( thermonuclease family)